MAQLTNYVPKPVYMYHTYRGADLIGLISMAHSSPVYVPPQDLCQPSQMMLESPGCRPNFLISHKGPQISRPESAQTTFFTHFNQFLTLLSFLVVSGSKFVVESADFYWEHLSSGSRTQGKIGNLSDFNLF